MDPDSTEEAMAEFRERHLGGWGILQLTAGTGLAVYAMWVGLIMPGFRRVPLKLQVSHKSGFRGVLYFADLCWVQYAFFLQVPYLPASRMQVRNVMALLRGRSGSLADLGSGDGRIVSSCSLFCSRHLEVGVVKRIGTASLASVICRQQFELIRFIPLFLCRFY